MMIVITIDARNSSVLRGTALQCGSKSIQPSKYPAQELCLAVMMTCGVQPPSPSLTGPLGGQPVGSPQGPLPGSPSGACWGPLRCYCSSVMHHRHTHPLGAVLGSSCGGGLVSFSQVPPGGVSGYRMTFSTVLQIIDPWVYFGELHTGPLYEEG
jgi:hypothetical protein